jgi:hypothetical protein
MLANRVSFALFFVAWAADWNLVLQDPAAKADLPNYEY